MPAFWFRAGSGSGALRWVIWLEGGNNCIDQTSCTARATMPGTAGLVTSAGFVASTGVGALSPDPRVNPALYNANTVYVHYCSSDNWSGGYASGTSFSPGDPSTWNFQGRRIALAAIASLRGLGAGFANADQIILGGSSAGAIGITITANDILPTLPPARDLRLVNDAGFTLNIGQYDPANPPPYIYSGPWNAFDGNFAAGLLLWHGHGDTPCAEAASTLQARIDCYDTALLLQRGAIGLPTFVAESQIDTAQVDDQICPLAYGACVAPGNPVSKQGQYATAFGRQMATALIGAGTAAAYAVASPDAYMHVILDDKDRFVARYPTPQGPVSPQELWTAWLASAGAPRIVRVGNGPGVRP